MHAAVGSCKWPVKDAMAAPGTVNGPKCPDAGRQGQPKPTQRQSIPQATSGGAPVSRQADRGLGSTLACSTGHLSPA